MAHPQAIGLAEAILAARYKGGEEWNSERLKAKLGDMVLKTELPEAGVWFLGMGVLWLDGGDQHILCSALPLSRTISSR